MVKKNGVVAASKKKNGTPLAAPPFLLNSADDESKKGRELAFSNCFERVADLLKGRKNVIVLLGAGISVSCGIPDFRSKDSGLYSTLDINEMGLSQPEELFDWDFFLENPEPFYKFARNLYFPLGQDKRVEPSDSHKLLAILEQNKMLLRVYSQNIDGLETVAGVSNKKIIYAHGNLLQACCINCKRKVSSEEILPDIIEGTVPRCKAETHKKPAAASSSFRRNSDNSTDSSSTRSTRSTTKAVSQRTRKRQRVSSDQKCGGVFKPTVTFFGENLNDNVNRALEADHEKVDALIVIGTSLSVAPISKVIDFFPQDIPRILINRTVVHPQSTTSNAGAGENGDVPFRNDYVFDAYLLGFCDDITRALAKQMFKQTKNSNNNKSKAKKAQASQQQEQYAGTLLSNVLQGKDEDFNADEWSGVTVPPERVLLFPGALPSKDDISEVEYKEIAHCDGCSKHIRGDIRKCIDCFDYDLCQKCFPKISKSHYGGKHCFTRCSQKKS